MEQREYIFAHSNLFEVFWVSANNNIIIDELGL